MKGITPGAYKLSLSQKLAYRIRISGRNSVHPACFVGPNDTCVPGIPDSWTLTEYSNVVGEPYAYTDPNHVYDSTDATGAWYTDQYFWYFCGPGATTVTLRYWLNTDTMGRQTYNDGVANLTWDNNYERSYLMHIALDSYPASFQKSVYGPNSGAVNGSPGEETYGASPSDSYTTFGDLANVLNWESSGHTSSTNYSQYGNGFYIVVGSNDLNLQILQSDVVGDIYQARVPLVASVFAADLPDWNNNQGSTATHFVSILGYNQTNRTFTYAETCGGTGAGRNTDGFGYYTIGQQQMLNAIYDAGQYSGGIVW